MGMTSYIREEQGRLAFVLHSLVLWMTTYEQCSEEDASTNQGEEDHLPSLPYLCISNNLGNSLNLVGLAVCEKSSRL